MGTRRSGSTRAEPTRRRRSRSRPSRSRRRPYPSPASRPHRPSLLPAEAGRRTNRTRGRRRHRGLLLGLLVGGCARRRRPDATRRRRVRHVTDAGLPRHRRTRSCPRAPTSACRRERVGARHIPRPTVGFAAEATASVFVGIGPAGGSRYIGGIRRDVVDDLDSSGDPEYSRRSGDANRPAGRQGVLGRVDEEFRRAGRSNGSRRTVTGRWWS